MDLLFIKEFVTNIAMKGTQERTVNIIQDFSNANSTSDCSL